MTRTVIVLPLLLACVLESGSAYAGACSRAIVRVQSQVDAAIEARLSAQIWRPESLSALRGYQPTPHSLAVASGAADLQQALGALELARAADLAGDSDGCRRELRRANTMLRGS